MLLAIDTSLGTSVGVVTDSGVAFDVTSPDPMAHAEVIGELIVRAIADAGGTASAVDRVVCGVGPGPYTGLRVGIAAAHAFAAGREVQLDSVVSHDAIAWDHPVTPNGELVVYTDARRRELYWSRYAAETMTGTHPRWKRIHGPVVTKPDLLPEGIPSIDGNVTGLRATALVELAAYIRENGSENGLEFETGGALYLRSPDVTPSNGPKRVTA